MVKNWMFYPSDSEEENKGKKEEGKKKGKKELKAFNSQRKK